MVRVRKLVMAIAAATALASGMAHALGLGEVTLRSSLNQPLVAEIELLDVKGLGPGEVVPALASIQEFNKAGVDRQYFLTDLTFTPVLRAGGKSVIRVTSSKPVREPYLNFLVEVLWPNGRLLREYTLLLDPPLYSAEAATPASAAPQLPIASVPQAPPQQNASIAAPPAANPSPAPSAEAARATEYRTSERDTLWQIAERTRQSGSVQQSMLAIQALNPDAFIDGNINRLKSGQVLRLPDAQQIASRGQAEALAQVAEQNAAWRQGRARPAGVRQIDATQRDAAGAAPSRSESGDKLRLVAADSGQASAGSDKGAANDIKALSDRLAASQESLDSTRRENAELAERLNDLQSQLDKLQRLMVLKDSQLGQLQAQLSSESEPADANAAPVAEETEAVSAADVETAAAAAEQAGEVAAATQAEPPATEPAANPAPGGQSESPVKPAAANDPAADDAARPGLLLNPLLLGVVGGGALLLLLIGLMVLSRRNAMREAEVQGRSLAAPGDEYGFDPADVNDPGAGLDAIAEPSRDGSTQVGGIAAKREDLLSEADIYIAYGRFNQAAELLHKALNDEPQRGELRLKLMEVYAELGDRDGFLREEAELREIGGADAGIEQLKAKYPALGLIAAVSASAATSEELDSFDFDSLDFDLDEPAPQLQVKDAPVAKSPLDDDPLELQNAFPTEGAMAMPGARPRQDEAMDEFSLDLERDARDTAEEASLEKQLAEFSLDLEADGGDSGAEVDDLLLSLDEPLADTSADDEEDFSLELPEAGAASGDFSQDFDLLLADEADRRASSAPDEMTAELDELSRQLGETGREANEIRPSVADSDTGELDEDFDFLSGTDETTTKLDLARAYIDMGDADGARDILDEVIGEGSDSQQQEAREMLAQLN